MRLRGRFKDPITFLRVVQTLSRLSSRCILRFSPDEIVAVVPRSAESSEAYAVFDKIALVFSEYRVESNSDNQVNVEIVTELLCDALKRMASMSDVTMKLAKQGAQALLNFDVVNRQNDSREVAILHSIPITVRKPRDMAGIRTPDEAAKDREDMYEVISSFPDLGEIRIVADRMRMMDPTNERITVASNRSGELRLAISSDEVKVATEWKGLMLAEESQQREHGQTGVQQAALKRFRSVDLDSKALGKVLGCPVTDYDAECWLAPKLFATFLVHVRSALVRNRKEFVAHIMITLPALSSGYDED